MNIAAKFCFVYIFRAKKSKNNFKSSKNQIIY